jgi:hypothetical protein
MALIATHFCEMHPVRPYVLSYLHFSREKKGSLEEGEGEVIKINIKLKI